MFVLLWFKQRWRLILLILAPLILLPLPILMNNSQAKCGYIVLILAVFWISEVIPLPVTSLLPLVLFPMGGILSADAVAPHYFKDIIALFLGSMAFSYAVELVNLHRRIALLVLSHVGMATKWIMAGMMGVTAFLSMWMNNIASTSIMLPVALALVDELEPDNKSIPTRHEDSVRTVSALYVDSTKTIECTSTESVKRSETEISLFLNHQSQVLFCTPQETELNKTSRKRRDELKKGFLLAVAYSSSIGGLCSLVGTSPNIYLKGFVDNKYAGTGFRVNFLNFLLFSLPAGMLMLIFCWLWLQLCYNKEEFLQRRPSTRAHETQANMKEKLTQLYADLGRPEWSELIITVIFILMIILWTTREFSDTIGWGMIFKRKYISDSTVAIFCGILPLVLPNSNPFNRKHDWQYQPIMNWGDLVQHISWGSILLLGAGLVIATAFEKSKLSNSVAQTLGFLSEVPRAAAIIIIVVISGLFTEVTSNLSTATIFFPVLDSVARSSGIHPAFLLLPCTLAVSLAFMLPISTAPNAIIFASGDIRVIDMIKTGVGMNCVGFLVIFLAANTWMPTVFDLNSQTITQFFNASLNAHASAHMA